MKRIIALIVICSMACIGLAACGSTAQNASKSPKTIELNQTITTDDYELTLTGVEWTNEVKVQVSDYYSWSFDAETLGGETMLVVKGSFKNLGTSKYSTMAMAAGFKVNDKYDLDGRASAHNSSISPLSTEDVFFYAVTSNEMRDAFKEGTMTLKLRSCTAEGDKTKFGDVIGEYVLKIPS